MRFRNYTRQWGATEDYFAVHAFLAELGYTEFTYARWDWMGMHSYLEKDAVGQIGLWEDQGRIVGLATFDCQRAETYLIARPGYKPLRREMLEYARVHLRADNGEFYVAVPDIDRPFQDMAFDAGFIPTERKEMDAAFYPEKAPMEYALPPGFHIASLKERYDPFEYGRVLWKGFGHEQNGEGEFVFADPEAYDAAIKSPHADLDLKIAVVAPDGHFAAYCGMWYEPAAGFAVIEPVATDPAYRKMGLGRAAVLEGVRRCAGRGAKLALVGSSQQFYYSIGLRPYATTTLWRERA